MNIFSHFGRGFKFEIRSLPSDLPAPIFDEKGEKFLRLALDRSAFENEGDIAAVQLVRNLRRRQISAEAILKAFVQSTWAARDLMSARGRVLSFGKFRGRTLGEVPRHYLEWLVTGCTNCPFNLRRAAKILLAADKT